jgi:hypothetical protein
MAWNPVISQSGDDAITYTRQPAGGVRIADISEAKGSSWNLKTKDDNLEGSAPSRRTARRSFTNSFRLQPVVLSGS